MRAVTKGRSSAHHPRDHCACANPPEDIITRFKRIYREGFDAVGIQEVKRRLLEATRGAKEAIVLCYEKVPEKFCHRRVFAACFEEQTGEVIEEVRGRAHGDVGYGEREGG